MIESVKIQPDQRILYPDILRIIAIFAVMMTHICAYGFFNYEISSANWQIANALDCLTRWAVPVFIMISGMFFLDPQKEITLKKLYSKNIFRIVVALLFWGILHQTSNVAKRLFFENDNANVAITDALKEFILGPAWYHLWFLYLIIAIYILVPLIRIFTKHAEIKHYRYLFIMFISFGCILPLLQELLLCTNKGLYFFNLKELPGYCSYLVLGFFLSKHEVSNKLRKVIYLIALTSFIIQFVGTSLISYKYGQASEILHRYFTPNVAIQAIAIFLYIKEFGSKKVFSYKTTRLIGLLGKYSFGMYLVHDFFNGIFYRIGLFSINIPPIISIPFRTFLTFIISFLTVCALAKIPIIKKYCI